MNYQGVQTEKLQSLQDFQRRPNESLRDAFTCLRRLIEVTWRVIEGQAVQSWYNILDKDLQQRVIDITLSSAGQTTLVEEFHILEQIELKMVEHQVAADLTPGPTMPN